MKFARHASLLAVGLFLFVFLLPGEYVLQELDVPDGQLEYLALAELLVGRVGGEEPPQLPEGARDVLLAKSFPAVGFFFKDYFSLHSALRQSVLNNDCRLSSVLSFGKEKVSPDCIEGSCCL